MAVLATKEEHADIVTIENYTRELVFGQKLVLPDVISDPATKDDKKNKKDRRKRKRGPRKKRDDTAGAEDEGTNSDATGEQSMTPAT